MPMISIKSPKEIEIMREGGRILAKIMRELKKKVAPGITTKELDELAENLIFKYGGKPSFKGYKGFPASLCVSLNEEIVHVVPSGRVLKEGDILSLDLGIFYPAGEEKGVGFHTDMAITLPVGKISFLAQKLIRVTKKALKIGIKEAKVGNTFGDIGNAIQKYVESQGFNVVRELCGHGIGRELHEDPMIPNYGQKKSGEKIKEGITFCLEPMVTIGSWNLEKTKDGFGYKTLDNSLSCHFEDTIAMTKNGPEILTTLEF